jgi:hypothetical protein
VGDSPDVGARYAGGSWRNGRRIAWQPSLRVAPRLAAARCAQDASLLAAAPGQEGAGLLQEKEKGAPLGWAACDRPKRGKRGGRGNQVGCTGRKTRWAARKTIRWKKEKRPGEKRGGLGRRCRAGPRREKRGGGKKARLGRTQGDRPKREGKGFSIYFSYLSHNSSLRMHNSQTLSLKQQRFIIQHDATTKEKISRVYY